MDVRFFNNIRILHVHSFTYRVYDATDPLKYEDWGDHVIQWISGSSRHTH